MKTIHKGAIAQLKVELRAAKKGFVLSKPCVDVRYDYILDDGRKLEKVQVKYGGGSASHAAGVVVVSLRGWKGKEYSRLYCVDEVDALLVLEDTQLEFRVTPAGVIRRCLLTAKAVTLNIFAQLRNS